MYEDASLGQHSYDSEAPATATAAIELRVDVGDRIVLTKPTQKKQRSDPHDLYSIMSLNSDSNLSMYFFFHRASRSGSSGIAQISFQTVITRSFASSMSPDPFRIKTFCCV